MACKTQRELHGEIPMGVALSPTTLSTLNPSDASFGHLLSLEPASLLFYKEPAAEKTSLLMGFRSSVAGLKKMRSVKNIN